MLRIVRLTESAAGVGVKAAIVKKPALMHFSPKYKDSLQLLIEEAAKAF